MMSIQEAIDEADRLDLPDGAWWAYVEELIGKDAGEISDYIASCAEGDDDE